MSKRQFNTLTGFLTSKSSNPSANDTVEFQGYDNIGDGGAATWQHNGVTGQTPSQSPAQLGGGLLNDGNGNQWALIFGQIVNFDGTQWFPLPFGNGGTGSYLYDENGWNKSSGINDLSQTYIFDTVALFKASLIEFPDGKTIHLNDRDADFTKITGTGTATGYKIIASTSVSQSIELRVGNVLRTKAFGVVGDTVADDLLPLQEVADTAKAISTSYAYALAGAGSLQYPIIKVEFEAITGIRLSGPVNWDHPSMEFSGNGRVAIVPDDFNDFIFKFTGVAFAHKISGFTFESTQAGIIDYEASNVSGS